MDNSASRIGIGSSEGIHRLHSSNPPSTSWKTYGFAIAIIIGGAGLVVGGVGVAGYLGAISNLNQVYAIMMAAGGGGGAILVIVGVVGTVKNCKTGGGRQAEFIRRTGGERQAEFIRRTGSGRLREDQRFGKAQWEMYLGDVGEEPPLPENLDEILNSPCPFSGDERVRVRQTHMLVLIPETVNNVPLDFAQLCALVSNPRAGYALPSNTLLYDDINCATTSHWVLMTRDVIPHSRAKTYSQQQALIRHHQNYTLPNARDTTICILMEHVMSGTRLFRDIRDTDVYTWTRCSGLEVGGTICVGGFDFQPRADRVTLNCYVLCNDSSILPHVGIAAVRQL